MSEIKYLFSYLAKILKFNMSARWGQRASGTDGSDFSHREQVASHYKDSVHWKSKLKLNLSLHFLLIVLAALWISLGYLKIVQHQTQEWEMVWLCSIIPTVFGLSSLPKNKHKQMYVYVIGSIGFGFVPLLYGASKYVMTILVNIQQEKSYNLDIRGPPIKLGVIAMVVQMQVTGLYFAVKLINAWKSKGEKRSS